SRVVAQPAGTCAAEYAAGPVDDGAASKDQQVVDRAAGVGEATEAGVDVALRDTENVGEVTGDHLLPARGGLEEDRLLRRRDGARSEQDLDVEVAGRRGGALERHRELDERFVGVVGGHAHDTDPRPFL